MQGTSLLELMKASPNGGANKVKSDVASQDRPQYAETDYPYRAFGWSSLRAWRAGKYLYIDAPQRELYDQSLDPESAHNLVDSAPSVADTMAAQLKEFRRKTSRAGKTEVVITPRQAEQLQALGYVSSGSSKPESEEQERGADPKDKVQIANLLHQALLESDEKNYSEAIPLFEQILKAEPKIALANLQLGRALNSLQDYSKALPWLQRAVELSPQSVEAHYELGAALGEMGDYAAAAKQLEAAVAQDPSSDELHFYLGSAYEEIDRAGDAMKQYQAAIELNPDNYRANLLLGRLLAIQDRPKEAEPLLQRAVKLDPQSADAHKFLGNVYTVLGEEEKARREEAEAQRLKAMGGP
jgi:tetratricopeptide (TPR) repeat protein